MRGHIRKRGNIYEIAVSVGKENGKYRYKYEYRPTKREADARLAQLMVQLQVHGSVVPSRLTTGDFLEQWLRDDVEHRLQPKTEATYRYVVNHYLVPLKDIRLQRLSTATIQRCLNALLDRENAVLARKQHRKISPSTVHQVYRVLKTALNTAVAWRLLTENPCNRVKPPTVDLRPATVWDEEQVRLFLAEAKRSSRHYCLYLTILVTGMRLGEVLALRWATVNLVTQEILVQQKFLRLYGKNRGDKPRGIWGATKTHQQIALSIPTQLLEEFRRHREKQRAEKAAFGEKYEGHDLVFCQPNGKPLHEENLNRRDFARVTKRAKLPRIRLYDLRHSCGSHMADQEPLPVVQRQLGHKDARTTQRYYVHVVRDVRQAVQRLEDRFFRQSTN